MRGKWRKFLGIFLLLAGAVVFMVPAGLRFYVNWGQKQMIAHIKEEMENSRTREYGKKEKKKNREQEYRDLELSEEDTVTFKPGGDVKELLKAQNVIGLIQIDRLNLLFAVVEGASRDNIRASIGHMEQTCGFGEKGNCVLAGHRGGVYGEFFKNIHKLKDGDKVKITDADGMEYSYSVYSRFVVEPSDFSVCDPVEDEKTLTLLSCEDHGKRRLIVRCRLD